MLCCAVLCADYFQDTEGGQGRCGSATGAVGAAGGSTQAQGKDQGLGAVGSSHAGKGLEFAVPVSRVSVKLIIGCQSFLAAQLAEQYLPG